MTDTAIEIKRARGLRRWRVSGRTKSLAGRWSKERIAEVLLESPHREFTLHELARLVYGTDGKTNRDNVRKHISGQRVFMMAKLSPFVTKYSAHGTIEAIKLYVATEHDDVHRLDIELQRMEERNEMSMERATKLREVLSLPPPTSNPLSVV